MGYKKTKSVTFTDQAGERLLAWSLEAAARYTGGNFAGFVNLLLAQARQLEAQGIDLARLAEMQQAPAIDLSEIEALLERKLAGLALASAGQPAPAEEPEAEDLSFLAF